MNRAIIIKKLKAATMLLQECYSAMQQEGADLPAAPKGSRNKVVDIKQHNEMKAQRMIKLSKKTVNQ